MNLMEKRALPEEALRIAWKVNKIVKSRILAVDMVRDLDGKYYVIEFSPVFQVKKPEQLRVNGVPGVYVLTMMNPLTLKRGDIGCMKWRSKSFLSETICQRD